MSIRFSDYSHWFHFFLAFLLRVDYACGKIEAIFDSGGNDRPEEANICSENAFRG